MTDVERRFWAKVDKTDTCWLWQASLDTGGYGLFRSKRRLMKAHRVAYLLLVGNVPDGMVLDHLCRVRQCVNPAHLEPVEQAENIRRGDRYAMGGYERSKTHCDRGHPFDAENTRLRRGCWRVCRACHREDERARQVRRRSVA